MLKQGKLSSELSPTKPTKTQTPNSAQVSSTPASFSTKAAVSEVPILNWDVSMIGEKTINKSSEKDGGTKTKVSTTGKKPRRQPVPIKSKFMESASARKIAKTPGHLSGKTPSSSGLLGKTPSTSSKPPNLSTCSNRQQKIEELNRENTFTFEGQELVGRAPAGKADRPPSPALARSGSFKNQPRPTIKQSIGGREAKSLKLKTRDISTGAPRVGAGTGAPGVSHNKRPVSREISVESDSSASNANIVPGSKKVVVTESQLEVLESQKLHMLYLLSNMQSAQDKLATKANAQIYQMWKVQEELRSECAAQEQTNLVKQYTCEVFDICNALLPVCSELTAALPRFDAHFSSLSSMLDSTRHFISTVHIAPMSPDQLVDLQDSLKQVIALLKRMYYEVNDDKENLEENGKDLALLKSCFENSLAKTCKAGALLKQIKMTADENLFLVSTMSKLEVNGDEKNNTDH